MTPNDDNIQTQQAPHKPNPALQRLDVFVGKWNTEGLIKESPSGPDKKLKATDIYEWLPGGFFLIHYVDGHMGDEEVKTIEIIGYDDLSQTYFTHSYDNQGSAARYQANLLDSVWTIKGELERFNGSFSDDGGTLSGTWEMSVDGMNWVSWMDIKLTKAV